MKRSGPTFTSKVKDMQIFFGLNVTGELDSHTLDVMRSPRCGVPDVEEYSALQGSRWNKNVISYRSEMLLTSRYRKGVLGSMQS